MYEIKRLKKFLMCYDEEIAVYSTEIRCYNFFYNCRQSPMISISEMNLVIATIFSKKKQKK